MEKHIPTSINTMTIEGSSHEEKPSAGADASASGSSTILEGTTLFGLTDQERRFLVELSKQPHQTCSVNRTWKVEIVERLYAKGLVTYYINSGLVRMQERGAIVVLQLEQQGWIERDAILTPQEERFLLMLLKTKRGMRTFLNKRYTFTQLHEREIERAITERLEGLGYIRISNNRKSISLLLKGRKYAQEIQEQKVIEGLVQELTEEPILREEVTEALELRVQRVQEKKPRTLYEYGLDIAAGSGMLCNLLQQYAASEDSSKAKKEIVEAVSKLVLSLEGICEGVGIDLVAALRKGITHGPPNDEEQTSK